MDELAEEESEIERKLVEREEARVQEEGSLFDQEIMSV
jgi:hypothetical protein